MSDHDHQQEHADDHEHVSAYDWRAELEAYRDEARHYYQHGFDWRGHEPPPGFDGPRWFAPDPAWRVEARLDRSAPGAGDQVTLTTSTGLQREMAIAGQLVFEADGGEKRLTAYVSHGADGQHTLFVPFRDATSGNESYGAGRYLEAAYLDDEHGADAIELDFNYAYNPSCVYSPAYDCPYPPPGNRLDVPVRAGERMP
jgi:uncharacterized protein